MKRTHFLAPLLASAFVLLVSAASGQRTAPPPPPPETELLAILRSDADVHRKMDACRMLGQVGTRTAVPVLAGLLGDDQLSDRARYALEQIPDPSVPQAIRAAIPKLRGRNLAGALMSLGARNIAADADRNAKVAAGCLKNGDTQVPLAAAYALGKIGTVGAARSIERALPAASGELKAALYDADLRCAAALIANGSLPAAAGIYDRLLASRPPLPVKLGAARGSVLAHPTDAAARIVRLLAQGERSLFHLGLELTETVPGAEVTRSIAAQIPRLPADRQLLLIAMLGQRGDRTALPAIAAAVNWPDAPVRVAALNGLARIGDASCIGLLLDAATSTDADVQAAAKGSLARLRGSAVDEALTEQVGGTDTARSLVAIECLARRQAEGAAPALLKVAREGSEPIRIAAIQALGEIAATKYLPGVLDALTASQSTAEAGAAEQAVLKVCGKDGDPAAWAESVAGRMGTAKPSVRAGLLRILASLGGKRALAAIRTSAKDEDGEVRDTAIRALCNWPGQDVASELIGMAREADNPSHRLLALRGYIRLASDESIPVEKRLAMCADAKALVSRDEEKRQWLNALAGIPSVGALEQITPLIDDGAVSEEACIAAAAVAGKLLGSGEPEKQSLPAISSALEKARLRAKSAQVQADIQRLLAKIK